jgi:ubiquinone/menaquinone biosynthesis C-methylase UbiE
MRSLLSRLHAWWEGDEVAGDDADDPNGPSALRGGGNGQSAIADGWPPRRLEAVQRMFAPGCTFPGGRQEVLQQIEPLGLAEEMTVLDIAAGIGTAVRIIAEGTGARADGLQEDPNQLEIANRLAAEAGLADKAVLKPGVLGHCAIEPESRDAVYGRQALLEVTDKDAAFRAIWDLLKPGGQVLLVEFAATGTVTTEDIQEWAGFENIRPRLITAAETKEKLAAAHFHVNAAEDITETYCRQVLHGLGGMADTLKQRQLPKELRSWVLWEAEFWARRVGMLQKSEIGMFRFHASKEVKDAAA